KIDNLHKIFKEIEDEKDRKIADQQKELQTIEGQLTTCQQEKDDLQKQLDNKITELANSNLSQEQKSQQIITLASESQKQFTENCLIVGDYCDYVVLFSYISCLVYSDGVEEKGEERKSEVGVLSAEGFNTPLLYVLREGRRGENYQCYASLPLSFSQKGGVGKSTLAQALAVEAKKQKIKVLLADCDFQQGTSYEWAKIKKNIECRLFNQVKDIWSLSKDYDLIVIDAPARTSQGTLEIAKMANLLIQPTGASRADL
ncbi:12833_t:CDS:2, partial [Racocetra persica]